jgi:hypothetical protein
MNDAYLDFLEKKQKVHIESGFDVYELNYDLFNFQKFVVKRALHHGKYAVFSGTGTGKTRKQSVWSVEVNNHTNKPVLILAPLAVSGQTIKEAKKIGVEIKKWVSCENYEGIYIINYEQLENLPIEFIESLGGVALDEASIIKNHEGAYRNKIIELFYDTPYKSVWTATPSPNDPMELGNYSEFLNIMPRNEMLAMYFVHDAGETQKWRLKGHAKQVFWEWVSTWAIMFQNPTDIGFYQDGFDLPPLNFIERKIITPKKDNGKLFNDVAVSATNFNSELRITKLQRLEDIAPIVNNSQEKFIIWIKQNEEGDLLRKLIPDAIEVKGSDTTEYKEEKLLGFSEGDFRVLISKTKICGSGLNYQICRNQMFPSPDFSFEALFQGIRRSWRFGQQNDVNIYITTTDTMTNVIQSIKQKEKQFEIMQAEMSKAVNKNLIEEKTINLKRKFKEYKTKNFMYQLGDSVQLIRNLESESVGFSIWSPPFPTLYVYSNELEDMGNCKDFNEFFTGFNFLLPDLNRVMMSGRNVAVHCMDVPIQKGKEGYIGLRDFSGMIIDSFQKAGFIYHSRVTLWKNPVTEMQRTKALGLLHKQIKKDASMCRVGIPDYLLIFRKEGENEIPIVHQDKDPLQPNYLPVDLWQKYASPIWMDIDFGDTLNSKAGKEKDDERHIAPLALPIINRALHLWSNEGDTVLTTYGGIGSEGVESIKLKRKAILFELKESYFNEGIQNCLNAEKLQSQKTLFNEIVN